MHSTKHGTLFIEDVLEERSVMWVGIDESEVGHVLEEPAEQRMCIFWQNLSLGSGRQHYTHKNRAKHKNMQI